MEARDVAVCLAPGTEVAFDRPIEIDVGFGFLPNRRLAERVARFRQVNPDRANMHHDALELPNGEVVLLTRLAEGQTATVLQLPASTAPHAAHETQSEQHKISA